MSVKFCLSQKRQPYLVAGKYEYMKVNVGKYSQVYYRCRTRKCSSRGVYRDKNFTITRNHDDIPHTTYPNYGSIDNAQVSQPLQTMGINNVTNLIKKLRAINNQSAISYSSIPTTTNLILNLRASAVESIQSAISNSSIPTTTNSNSINSSISSAVPLPLKVSTPIATSFLSSASLPLQVSSPFIDSSLNCGVSVPLQASTSVTNSSQNYAISLLPQGAHSVPFQVYPSIINFCPNCGVSLPLQGVVSLPIIFPPISNSSLISVPLSSQCFSTTSQVFPSLVNSSPISGGISIPSQIVVTQVSPHIISSSFNNGVSHPLQGAVSFPVNVTPPVINSTLSSRVSISSQSAVSPFECPAIVNSFLKNRVSLPLQVSTPITVSSLSYGLYPPKQVSTPITNSSSSGASLPPQICTLIDNSSLRCATSLTYPQISTAIVDTSPNCSIQETESALDTPHEFHNGPQTTVEFIPSQKLGGTLLYFGLHLYQKISDKKAASYYRCRIKTCPGKLKMTTFPNVTHGHNHEGQRDDYEFLITLQTLKTAIMAEPKEKLRKIYHKVIAQRLLDVPDLMNYPRAVPLFASVIKTMHRYNNSLDSRII